MIALISHASKVMFKILQARLQQYVNCELPDVWAGFRKSTGTRDQIANICWIIEKAKKQKKKKKHGKRWEFQTTWPASWETCMQVKKQQLEPNMEQTGSKLGKE